MLGIELLLTLEEKAILNLIREELEGFNSIEDLNNKAFSMCQGDSMPYLLTLEKFGLVVFGERNNLKTVVAVDWITGKLPKGFSLTSNEIFEIKNEVGPNRHGLNFSTIFEDQTEVGLVFEYWKKIFHSRKNLSTEDKGAIKRMLKEYSIDQIKKAIIGLSYSEFHQGANPQNVRYQSLRHVAKNVDLFLQLEAQHG